MRRINTKAIGNHLPHVRELMKPVTDIYGEIYSAGTLVTFISSGRDNVHNCNYIKMSRYQDGKSILLRNNFS